MRGIRKVAHEVKKSKTHRKLQDKVASMKKKLRKAVGRDAIQKEIDHLTQVIQAAANPQTASAELLRRGTLHWLTLDYAAAVTDLRAFLAAVPEPENANAHYLLGNILSSQDTFDEANTVFTAGLVRLIYPIWIRKRVVINSFTIF